MTDQAKDTYFSALPKWLLEQIPLLDQPILTLCRDNAHRDNMNSLQEMDLAVDNRLWKCRKYLSSIDERMTAINNMARNVPQPQFSKSANDFAKDSREVKTKVREAVTEAVAGLQELLGDIRKTKGEMRRMLGIRRDARGLRRRFYGR
ncbi:MAG: hypothetical protein L6R38_007968 [Xanthoria sp. 2 TBL-2021]|nr:MAG: hypothetical protein L6R38_007968 [Xanthoria sp. 2 TBL-2021]